MLPVGTAPAGTSLGTATRLGQSYIHEMTQLNSRNDTGLSVFGQHSVFSRVSIMRNSEQVRKTLSFLAAYRHAGCNEVI